MAASRSTAPPLLVASPSRYNSLFIVETVGLQELRELVKTRHHGSHILPRMGAYGKQ